jgi:hypothetical protein
MMEEGEEEQADPDDVSAQYCDFAMEEGEEEMMQKTVSLKMTMLLVMSFTMHREIAKVKRRRISLTRC